MYDNISVTDPYNISVPYLYSMQCCTDLYIQPVCNMYFSRSVTNGIRVCNRMLTPTSCYRPVDILLCSLELYFFQTFTFIVLGYRFCYHTSPTRPLKLVQKRERQSLTFWTSEQRSEKSKGREVVLGTLLKLQLKDKLLHSGKVPVNAELRPLRREKRGTEAQGYGTLNEAMM